MLYIANILEIIYEILFVNSKFISIQYKSLYSDLCNHQTRKILIILRNIATSTATNK